MSQPNRFVVLVGRETQPSSLESRWQREEIECSESHFIYSIHFKKKQQEKTTTLTFHSCGGISSE